MALPTNIPVASDLLSDVYVSSVRNFGRIRTFRDVAQGAVNHPRTAARLYKEAYTMPDELNRLLPAPPPPESEIYTESGRDAMAQEVTANALTSTTSILDAACFVFGHAILDDLTTQCCQVISHVDPESFRKDLEKKNVELGEMENTTVEAKFVAMLNSVVKQIGKSESLGKRLDRIMRASEPTSGTKKILELPYVFDRSKIGEIDMVRQEILHRVNLAVNRNVDEDLLYMQQTGLFMMNALISKFFMTTDFSRKVMQKIVGSAGP
jgi:hypothetical protein